MITRKMLLASCAVGVLAVMAGPALAQSAQGGTPSDAAAAAANRASPPPVMAPSAGAPGASQTGAETGTPGANGTSTGSALAGDTSARANQRGTTSSGNSVQEVVVTAEKRSQSIQRVPAAVTAFTSEKRDLIGIDSIQDMTNFTPGLQYSASTDRASLRGVGRQSNVQSAESAVAVYQDGIYTTSTVNAGKSSLFVDRTEVLRGPQGTLYGRNSIGGAINVLSRRPTDEWYGEARVTGANYGQSIVEGAVSGPIVKDAVDFRLAGFWNKQRDGYFQNIVTGQPDEGGVVDNKYFEGQLKFKFGERAELWMRLDTQMWNGGAGNAGSRSTWYDAPYATNFIGVGQAQPQAGFGLFTGPGAPTNVVNANPLGALNPQLLDPRTIASVNPYKVKLTNNWDFASEFVYHMDSFDIKYVAGGTHYDYTLEGPTSPNAAPILQYTIPALTGGSTTVYPTDRFHYQEDLSWFSHEINITSTTKGPFQWIVGAYHYGEGESQPVRSGLLGDPAFSGTPAANATCFAPGFGGVCPPVQGREYYDDRPHLEIRSNAVFGQIDWEFIPTFKTTLGIRYSNDHKFGYEDVRYICYLLPSCYGGADAQIAKGLPLIDLTQVPSVVSTNVPPAPGTVGPTTYDPATGFSHRQYKLTTDAVTGTAGLQWEPERGTLAYAKYSRGYKAGGFLIGINTVQTPTPETDPEFVNAYEIGLKKSLFDRSLSLNLAAFYYDYQNAQFPVSIASAGGLAPTQAQLFNVPKAISKGVELEAIWNPIHNLNIIFNYSYLDATIDQGSTVDPADPTADAPGAKPLSTNAQLIAAGTCIPDTFATGLRVPTPVNPAPAQPTNLRCQRFQDLSGNHLPNAPDNKVAINVNYTLDTAFASITPSVSYTWRDVQYGSLFDRSYYQSPSSGQLDARVSFRDPKDKWTVIVYGKNITDELVYDGGATALRQAGYVPVDAVGTLAGNVQGTYSGYPLAPPRTYGVELQYRFF